MNMSYCRFQNTLQDLQDCARALADEDELSAEEEKAKKRLISLCRDIVHECDCQEENEDAEDEV